MRRTPSQPKYTAIKESYPFIGHHKFLKGVKRNPNTIDLNRAARFVCIP